MTMRKSAAKKKAASKKTSVKRAVVSRTLASGQFVVFDSPLKPKHVTGEQIRRAVKAAA